MARKQRALSSEETDRFLVTVTGEMGRRIRRLSDKLGVTYSKLIGDLVEEHIDELEAQVNDNE